jgi:hypothetical protein
MPAAPGRLNNPDYWLGRAEEVRVIAERMIDDDAREMLLRVADTYEGLAKRAEQRRIAKDPR